MSNQYSNQAGIPSTYNAAFDAQINITLHHYNNYKHIADGLTKCVEPATMGNAIYI
jgi:hypothetical protein